MTGPHKSLAQHHDTATFEENSSPQQACHVEDWAGLAQEVTRRRGDCALSAPSSPRASHGPHVLLAVHRATQPHVS